MGSSYVKFDFRKFDYDEFVKFINGLDAKSLLAIEKEVDSEMNNVKRIVKSNLRYKHGVDKGIYKSFIGKNKYRGEVQEICVQVGGKKGHHRLTHLLEHGHRIVSHGVDTGKRTRAIQHMYQGQEHINKVALELFEKGLNNAIKKG